MNKLCKGNYTEKDQRDDHVLPQSMQHHLDGSKVGQRNLDTMKEDFPPMTMTPKSNKLVKSTATNLKAMQGLVLNRNGRSTVDEGQATWMRKRERKDGVNDVTNNVNLGSSKELHDNSSKKELHDSLSSRKELLPEEKPKSHDANGSEGGNPSHRTKKRQRKYIETNENEDDNGGLDGVATYSTKLTSQDDILKDCHDGVSVTCVVDYLGKQCYCCSKPIDETIWRYDMMTGSLFTFGVFTYLSSHY
jgi:hypothetical protein